MMREISLIITIKIIVSFTCAQSDFGQFRPMARGAGHYISNGRYHNQAPQQPSNLYQVSPAYYYNQQQQQQSSNNVIGNTAENIYGSSFVNSIINSRFNDASSSVNSIINPASGSSNNVIGNKAYNTQGGSGSVVNSAFYNLPGLSAAYNNPYGAEWTSRLLQNAFSNLR